MLTGEDERGRPVVVVHEDSPALRSVAVFDAVINNSDRKGSHLVREGDALRGFDHGVSLHEEDKLRTVLWGFAGQAIERRELDRVQVVLDAVTDPASPLRTEPRRPPHAGRGDRAGPALHPPAASARRTPDRAGSGPPSPGRPSEPA